MKLVQLRKVARIREYLETGGVGIKPTRHDYERAFKAMCKAKGEPWKLSIEAKWKAEDDELNSKRMKKLSDELAFDMNEFAKLKVGDRVTVYRTERSSVERAKIHEIHGYNQVTLAMPRLRPSRTSKNPDGTFKIRVRFDKNPAKIERVNSPFLIYKSL